jgi:hypothetical protein
MPRTGQEVVSWDAFKWVVMGLLTLVAVLVGLLYNNLDTDVDKLQSEVVGLRVDLVRGLGEMTAQQAATNAKLDLLVGSPQP